MPYKTPAQAPELAALMQSEIEKIKQIVKPDECVLLAWSGGVDSTAVAHMLKAAGVNFKGVLVDHGAMRAGEIDALKERFADFGDNFVVIDASKRYLDAISGTSNSEEIRKIIRGLFIDVFADAAANWPNIKYFAQGTILTDNDETKDNIKTHHNTELGNLATRQGWSLIEPLAQMRKVDVRTISTWMGIAEKYLERDPFPGPGGYLRDIGGVITRAGIEKWRIIDEIVNRRIKEANIKSSQSIGAHAFVSDVITASNAVSENLYNIGCANEIIRQTLRDAGAGIFDKYDISIIPNIITTCKRPVGDLADGKFTGSSEPVMVISNNLIKRGVNNSSANGTLHFIEEEIANKVNANLPIGRVMFNSHKYVIPNSDAYIIRAVETLNFIEAAPVEIPFETELKIWADLQKTIGNQVQLWRDMTKKPFATIEYR